MEIQTAENTQKKHCFFYHTTKESFEFHNPKHNSEIKNTLKKELTQHNFNSQKEDTKELFTQNTHAFILKVSQNPTLEEIRKAGHKTYTLTKNYDEVGIEIPFEDEEEKKEFLMGYLLSTYSFNKYLSKKETITQKILCENISQELIEKTKNLAQNVFEVRNLVNENSDIATPEFLEKKAVELAKKHNLKTHILDEKEIVSKGLNLLYAVGKGSSNPPRLVIVEYTPNPNSSEMLALVGKGITFDTGGTNLKPSGYIEDMRLDMGGAATAFGTFKELVEQKHDKNLVLVMPCAENSISHNAYKPGDVVTGYAGISVEVLNTDAEGRLVLADALSYLQENFKPTQIIDMATLTGACPVALGPSLIAVMGNSQKTIKEIFSSGEKTGERVWQLPIYDEHREMLKSPIADCKNIGGKFGGAITAAAFLEQFIKEGINWTHLDIAGAAWFKSQKEYIPQYATGIGVRLLVDYIISSNK